MKNIMTRRSIRKYLDKDISNELLTRLLAQAERTQTMGNLQLYSVIVTRDAQQKEKLAPAHFNQSMIKEAPVVVTVCADTRRTTLWAKCRKAHPGFDNLLSFMNAVTDALLFTQTFCNLAEEAGLGCCFLGTTIYNPDTIINVLQLPRLVMPVATITLGWPNECPPLSDRLPLQAVTHAETYHDYNQQSIDAWYKEKENLPENRAFVQENHKETLAQVFTDCRYTKADNEAMSATFAAALKRQGFMQ